MPTATEQIAEVRVLEPEVGEIVDAGSHDLVLEALARCGDDAAHALAQAHALAARIAGIDEARVLAQTRTVWATTGASEDHGAFVANVRVLVEAGQ